jgi:hypothetical protein
VSFVKGDVVIVKFSAQHLRQDYVTEIPCEADPTPFAVVLIEQARVKENLDLDTDTELKYCTADGSPLR